MIENFTNSIISQNSLVSKETTNVPPDIKDTDAPIGAEQSYPEPSLGRLVLTNHVFDHPFLEKLKSSQRPTSLNELFEEFYHDKESVRTIFFRLLEQKNNVKCHAEQKTALKGFPTLAEAYQSKSREAQPLRQQTEITNKPLDQRKPKKRAPARKLFLPPPPIKEDDFQSLIDGTLELKRQLDPEFAHCFLYFDFGVKGVRSVERIRSFLKALGIDTSKVSWIDLIDSRRIEIACRESIKTDVISKLGSKIIHLSQYDVDSLYNGTEKELKDILPQSPEIFAKRMLVIVEKLNLLKIRRQLSNYVNYIVDKIYTRIGTNKPTDYTKPAFANNDVVMIESNTNSNSENVEIVGHLAKKKKSTKGNLISIPSQNERTTHIDSQTKSNSIQGLNPTSGAQL